MIGCQLSPRDMVVLTVVAEMYGAPLDRVAAMLGVSMPSTYRCVSRWRNAGMASKLRVRPVPGPAWVFTTRSATEALLDIPARYWTPTPKMAAHVTTTLDLRVALTGLDLERWISERELRSQVGRVKEGQTKPHIHDGRFYDDQGRLWAVEVELTAKNLAQAKVAVAKAKQAAKLADCAGIIYYCKTEWTDSRGQLVRRSDEITNVIREAVHATAQVEGPPVRIADIDKVLGAHRAAVAAESRPGLRVIEGGASDHVDQDDADGSAGVVVSS
ncbi:hypothetical protein [Nocardia brasiliensis]|uniref:hypothetical protein n=1 Tax=Nocardia brasiliensis TaxID=37326 RepID=UPI002458CBBF|nr:hypothetical protein [Nocardia brasiliensis]